MFTRLIKWFMEWKNKPWTVIIEQDAPVWAGSEETKQDLLNEISKQIQIDMTLENKIAKEQ